MIHISLNITVPSISIQKGYGIELNQYGAITFKGMETNQFHEI